MSLLALLLTAATCRRRNTDFVTVALPEKFTTLDTLTTTQSDSASERIKNLMLNTLVRKDENFDYVGELAKDIATSPDGTTLTFTLRDNVKFHNGKVLTSADIKYTFDELFKSDGNKAKAFYDTVPLDEKDAKPAAVAPDGANANAAPKAEPKTKSVPHITSISTPDEKTVVFAIARAGLRTQLLSNLVAVPIIPEGTVAQQKDSPVGSGPFKFVAFDASQGILELAAFSDYWEGAPKVAKLRVKSLTDASGLTAELQTGEVDIAPNPTNLPPDILRSIQSGGQLNVAQSDGSNIQYLVFNISSGPLANVKVRQAIGYALDRQKIVKELLSDQAKAAASVLPPQSWAYTPGKEYTHDPDKARQLLQEAGYKGEPIVFKFRANSAAVSQYAQAIQSSLNDVGLNIQIETLDGPTILQHLRQGQFQMYTGIWIGGNQDPIFMRDLFSSTKIPSATVSCCNRSRYSNAEVDKLVEDALNATDKAVAKQLYTRTWEIVSNDLPLMPLWYPANIVVSNKRIGNTKISPSGDWTFLKDITVSQ